MEYLAFKAEYIRILTALLTCKDTPYPNRVDSPESNRLANLLADMEEEHPIWVERIEDSLAKEAKASGETNYLLFT